jgi:Terminase large subunit, T4likevirus-type, N-terminal
VTGLGDALAVSLDPVLLARRLGIEPDPWQVDVLRGSEQYRVLNCCRQSGKSTTAAVLALHTAQSQPGSLVLLVSPGMRQSQLLYRTVRAYWRALGRVIPAEQENLTSLTLESGSEIVCLPGTGDSIRGYSAATLIIIDEASGVDAELMPAVRPMVSVSRGRLLMMSTPFGPRGPFWAACTGQDRGWVVTTVTARQCPRISAEFLELERAELGDLQFRSEYLCEFVEGAGAYFDVGDVDRAFQRGEPFDPTRPLRRRLWAVPSEVPA